MTNRASIQAGLHASSRVRTAPALAIILVSYLMIVLDISIVITALPQIRHNLNFSATGLSWVQNAYTLAFGGLLLLSACAGDILGRRRLFVVGLALFTAASLAIGPRQNRSAGRVPPSSRQSVPVADRSQYRCFSRKHNVPDNLVFIQHIQGVAGFKSIRYVNSHFSATFARASPTSSAKHQSCFV